MTLARFEGYKEATVSGFRSDSGEVRTSTNNYDAGGHLLGLTDDTGYDTAHRQFVNDANDANDANGIVLQKTQQANALKQLVVMGQVMARVVLHATRPPRTGQGNPARLPPHTATSLRQLGSEDIPGGTVQSHLVRTGNTLQGIVQIYSGNASARQRISPITVYLKDAGSPAKPECRSAPYSTARRRLYRGSHESAGSWWR